MALGAQRARGASDREATAGPASTIAAILRMVHRTALDPDSELLVIIDESRCWTIRCVVLRCRGDAGLWSLAAGWRSLTSTSFPGTRAEPFQRERLGSPNIDVDIHRT